MLPGEMRREEEEITRLIHAVMHGKPQEVDPRIGSAGRRFPSDRRSMTRDKGTNLSPDADRIADESAAPPVYLKNGRATLQVADGKIHVCPPEESEPREGSVVIAEPLMGLFWASKEEHDQAPPGSRRSAGILRMPGSQRSWPADWSLPTP